MRDFGLPVGWSDVCQDVWANQQQWVLQRISNDHHHVRALTPGPPNIFCVLLPVLLTDLLLAETARSVVLCVSFVKLFGTFASLPFVLGSIPIKWFRISIFPARLLCFPVGKFFNSWRNQKISEQSLGGLPSPWSWIYSKLDPPQFSCQNYGSYILC